MNNDSSATGQPLLIESVEPEDQAQGYVLLPVTNQQWKGFVKSLLGSPQTITKTLRGTYEIDRSDIRNLYQLIDQRISQQNGGVLAQFSATIKFSDNSSVELNSIEDFLSYNEVSAIISKSVHLTWDYVLRFQDKEFHEKQRIQVSFLTDTSIMIDEVEFNSASFLAPSKPLGNGIRLRVEHTARSWGTDITTLLSNHINSLFIEQSKLKMFLLKQSGPCSLISMAFFLLAIVVSCINQTHRFAATRQHDLQLATNSLKTAQVNASTLNFIANTLARVPGSNFFLEPLLFY